MWTIPYIMNSPVIQHMNDVLHFFVESGKITKFVNKWNTKIEICDPDDNLFLLNIISSEHAMSTDVSYNTTQPHKHYPIS